MTEYSATLCIVLFLYFSTLENTTINNYINCRITDCTVVLRVGSVVSVPSNHFGDYHRRDHYYGTVLKLIQGNKKACVKWYDDDAVPIEEVELLQLETSIPKFGKSSKTNTILPEIKKKKLTLCIAAPLNTASNIEETEF